MSQLAQGPSDAPFPPRLWWTKRIAVTVLMLAVLLTVARLWWGHSAHRALQARLDALHAAGEPVSVADIQPPAIDDKDNAALLWQQAMQSINANVDTPSQSNLEFKLYPPWSDKWHQMLNASVKGNAKSLALARQARARPKASWPMAITSPVWMTLLPSLNDARNLADVVGDASIYDHLHNDDFEAIEKIRDVRRLGSDIYQQPFLISGLVGMGVHSLALTRLEMIAPDLQIEGTPESHGHPATRQQIESLINELLAESEDALPLHRVLSGENVGAIDMMQFSSKKAPLMAPMFERTALEDMDAEAAAMKASNQVTLAGAKRLLPAMPGGDSTLPPVLTEPVPWDSEKAPRVSRMINQMFAWDRSRVIRMDMRVRAEKSLAALALAVRLYRVDHGDWPASADALAPKYSPRIGLDPFATDKSVGYLLLKQGLPDGGDRPLIYSVGTSGDTDVDPTFAATYAPKEPCFGWDPGSIQFRDLARWSPATTQPDDSSP